MDGKQTKIQGLEDELAILRQRVADLEFSIGEFKKAETAIVESEQRFKLLYQLAPFPYQSLDEEGNFTEVNHAWLDTLGYEREDVIGRNFSEFLHPDWVDHFKVNFPRFKAVGEVLGVEFEMVKKGGQPILVSFHGRIGRDVQGGFPQSYCVFQNITEQRRAEKRLRENEERYRRIVETANEGIFETNADQIVISVNQKLADMLGYLPEEIIGKQLECHLFPEDLDDQEKWSKRNKGRDGNYERCLRRKDGGKCWAKVAATAVKTEDGKFIGAFGMVTDITERKQAEDALRKSEERFLLAVDASKDGIWDWNLDTDHVYYSPAYVTMLGYGPDEVPADSSTWADRIHPEDKDAALKANIDCIENRRDDFAVEFRMQAKNGEWRWILGRGKAVHRNAKGRAVRMVGTHTDITESKRAEAERINMERRLQKLQKAESLGRMAGSIAHHFNNKLGAVLGNLELALYDLSEGSGVRASILKSMKAAHQAADVSQMMLVYLGQTIGPNEPIDLVATIRELLQFSMVSVPRHVHLKTDYPPMRAIIHGNSDQIKQLLANLVSNATEAIGQNDGDITVAIQVVQRAEINGLRLFPIDWEPNAEQYVCLSVSDTGCGMDLSTIENVFDPFFSTKFKGRGLGLSILLGLVRAHDGATTVVSTPGRDTTFRVFFPLHALEALPPLKEEPLVSRQVEKGGLVLLVDDDPEIRDMAKDMLERMGYGVLAASSGAEAVKLFEEDPEAFRLVITDLTMPGIDGWETLTVLRKIRADIPVVLASGYDEAHAMGRDCADHPDAFLHKPYSMDEIKSAIDKSLQTVSRG